MFNRILLILMWIILCPTIVQAQSATVVVWGNYVWIDGVSMSMDEYSFLYGGGAGGQHAEDDAVAIENSDLSGGGASYYGPWIYIGEYGKWTSISGKIDVGSAWADNTVIPGNITITVSVVCKMSYRLTS